MEELVKTAGKSSGGEATATLQEGVTTTPRGLRVPRRWTRPTVHPYDEITWELRTAAIANEKGEMVFEQKDVEVPSDWSQLATNVAASKYFYGDRDKPERDALGAGQRAV